MEIGDKVRHKVDGTIAQVVYSSFGFSLHWWEEGRLCKTLGDSPENILKHWEIIKEDNDA